ncbi:MAG: hypothetical protein FJX72_01705 [Armatimonadetes bacterium]|nr:hypothetical protein [Armatimonadota bacterium]
MKVEEFRRLVRHEFGQNLQYATPANVRDFLDGLAQKQFEGKLKRRIVLDEPKTTYEEILKDFFSKVLEMPKDEALILLWTMAFELSFEVLEHHLSDSFNALFGEPS